MQRMSRRGFVLSLGIGAGGALIAGCGRYGATSDGWQEAGGGWRADSASAQSPPHPLTPSPGDPPIAPVEILREESWALGTKTAITVAGPDREAARTALRAARAELALVDRLMSLYRPDSPLCRLNRCGLLDDPHPYLVTVLRHAQAVSRETDGAFDVTVQPLWTLYSAAAKAGGLPVARDIKATLARVDWHRVEIAPRRIRLCGPDAAVTLNGIAQGFAADCAMAALRRHGIRHALVDAGEIGTLGGKGPSEPWKVGIQHPRRKDAYVEIVKLDGRCLSTSGDYATSFDGDFQDHHIFDPHTGRSPAAFSGVTIAAPTATQADALSTAVFVLGAERGLQLVRSTPSVDALLVLKDGRTLATEGFPAA